MPEVKRPGIRTGDGYGVLTYSYNDAYGREAQHPPGGTVDSGQWFSGDDGDRATNEAAMERVRIWQSDKIGTWRVATRGKPGGLTGHSVDH